MHEKVAAAMKIHIIPGGWVLKTGGGSQIYLVGVLKKLAGISAATKKSVTCLTGQFFEKKFNVSCAVALLVIIE